MVALVIIASGCQNPACDNGVYSCELDEECQFGGQPPGRCLDDHETGKVCALYFYTCPTKLQWDYCAGRNDKRSSWAGRCVRPEFIPGFDASTGAPDMSVSVGGDDGGPT